ncbi:MAG: T9SS type A sorting domain-containing protein, partial [Saprospiraceae bacterium]|nr:T9SS type A sorting domain-containing protein [Saprospiraceae bacterium]
EVSNVNAPPIAGELKAYPNPVEDFLTVDLDLEVQTSEVTFHITDNTGKQLYEVTRKNYQTGNTSFHVGALPAGTYYVTVRDGKGISTIPFSKI